MAIVKSLKARGVAVVYISHRLDEIFKIADRVTVMRDGKHISTRLIADVTNDGMVRDMVGRAVDQFAFKSTANDHGDVLLQVRNLGCEGIFADVNFDLHRGEVLCLAGLIGSRRTDVGLALFGLPQQDQCRSAVKPSLLIPRKKPCNQVSPMCRRIGANWDLP